MTALSQQLVELINPILTRKGAATVAFDPDASLYADGVGLDSMDTAELSVQLELVFGRDPYTAGESVATLGELEAWFTSVLS